jgi:hypothetical protein
MERFSPDFALLYLHSLLHFSRHPKIASHLLSKYTNLQKFSDFRRFFRRFFAETEPDMDFHSLFSLRILISKKEVIERKNFCLSSDWKIINMIN